MPKPNQIDLSIRAADGQYGHLIVEVASVSEGSRMAGRRPPEVIQAPLLTALTGPAGDPSNNPRATAETGGLISKPWTDYITGLTRLARNLRFFVQKTPVLGPMVLFTVWAIRELDVEWWAEVTGSTLSSSGTTLTPALTNNSRYGQSVGDTIIGSGGSGYDQNTTSLEIVAGGIGAGAEGFPLVTGTAISSVTHEKRGWGYLSNPSYGFTGAGSGISATPTLYPWAPGHYFVINDETISGFNRSYEVCRIVSINYTTGAWTIERGLLGTTARSHGVGSRFYLLIPHIFYGLLSPYPAPQNFTFPMDAAVICRIEARLAIEGAPTTALNYFSFAATAPPTPGLRTMSGNEYIMRAPGAFAANTNTDKTTGPCKLETLRWIQAEIDVNTTNPINVLVAWIDPDTTVARWVGTVTIGTGKRSATYNLQQMPTTTHVWPPNMLPLCVTPFDGAGNLVNTLTINTADKAQMNEFGYFRAVVLLGSGEGLRVTVKT